MGVARVRPSRNIYTVTIDEANLPSAASGKTTSTWKFEGIPNRGIVHAASLKLRDLTALNNTGVNAIFFNSLGTVSASGGGDNGISTATADDAIFVSTFKISDAPSGALNVHAVTTGPTTPDLYSAQIQLLDSNRENVPDELAYDLSGGVLGPDSNDATLYVTLWTGGFNWTGLEKITMTLEIEPCF